MAIKKNVKDKTLLPFPFRFLKLTSRRVEVHAVIAMPSKAKESTKTITKTMINPLKRMEAEPCCRASVLVL